MLPNKIYYILAILASIIIAATFPITNDEAYYIAFAKDLQLSYVDAPPFVAYLNVIQTYFNVSEPLILRSSVIILHLFASLLLMLIVKNNYTDVHDLNDRLLGTFLLSYIIPIFGLYGIFILPDIGLIVSLSIMVYVSDKVFREIKISLINTFLLGVGLGIGGLSKYHILPLGGGMLLGLLLDLSARRKFKPQNIFKLIISGLIGIIISAPVFIWNLNNNYASFIFQLQHGFSSNSWQLLSLIAFIIGALVYLTPWFTVSLIKNGLLANPRKFIIIPFFSLLIILLISSLRKSILPHWIAPAFWLLIPYAVIGAKNFQTIKTMLKYTSLIWLLLIAVLLLPGGASNIKLISKQINPDTTNIADLFLWGELPELIKNNEQIQKSLVFLTTASLKNCLARESLIGSAKWYWVAQLEYHRVFANKKVLNLDPNSSSFYLWRDGLDKYAYCPIMFIGAKNSQIEELISIKDEYVINGMGDYRSLNIYIFTGYLKDEKTLNKFRKNLLNNPKY